jgi:dihydrofolate reductase
MAKLISTIAMTVDGLADVTDWFVVDGEHTRASFELLQGAEAMLMGRPTYEGLAAYWSPLEDEWANLLNAMPKYVASRTASASLDWNAPLLDGDAKDAVRSLKPALERDLVLIGCGELARELLGAGLVDEIRFGVHPALGGPGTRPFDSKAGLELLETVAYDSGVTLLRYRPLIEP